MGRGRAKAKQAKVARELKYSVPEADFKALERELSSKNSDSHDSGFEHDRDFDYERDSYDQSDRDRLVD